MSTWPISPSDLARAIILSHTEDIDELSIGEFIDGKIESGSLTDDEFDAYRDEVEQLISDATVTVSWGEDEQTEVERLKARLAAAEMACLAFGAMGARMETDREKAAYELWWEWTQLEPRPDLGLSGPLTNELIARLARRRDEKRAQALEGIQKSIGGETP